jgi:transposase
MTGEVDHMTSTNGVPGGFQPITVIAGTARRRRFTAAEKARIVAESLDRAVSVSAVAHRYAINPNQLFTWRQQLRAAGGRDERVETAGAPFVAADVIEMIVGGVTIRVRSGVRTAALRRVLAALGERP